jgi:uncharacterized membrane protein SpoIIM required for sporulation
VKAEDILEKRKVQWSKLEEYLSGSRLGMRRSTWSPEQVLEFSELYRAACTDLALAQAYRLPPQTVDYLHNLVGRAHNRLYRSQKYDLASWWNVMFHDAPQQIFRDPCVHVATLLFFGLFFISALIAWNPSVFPSYVQGVLGEEQIEGLETSFAEEIGTQGSFDTYAMMAGFYIRNNTGIGLQCFGFGPLILPTLYTLIYNAVVLGASFGYMARSDVEAGKNFFEFVTAHGPFELSAIALSAGAGLRLGLGVLATAGFNRMASFKIQARRSLPVIAASATLFILAAFTEGFISPSPLPYALKALWAVMSSTAMMFYFVVLGAPRENTP